MLFLFSKFKKRKWIKLNTQKRLEVYAALEKKFAKKQHREPLKVRIHPDVNWNCFGAFTTAGGEKQILINEDLVIDPKYRFHGMETILHEGRHAYQYETINKDLPWYAFRAKRWRKNWLGYIPSGENSTAYNNQAVEKDAQKYALKIMHRLAHKYADDQDWRRTINANERRLTYADDNARKEFGMFYKHKINKMINQNAQNRYKK